jgi:tryptophan-rich sensory protein
MTAIASRSQLRMSFLRYALVTVPAVLLLGMVSGAVSNSGYGNPWFDALEKPEFMPPAAAFPIAWTILYVFLGLALAMILHARGARGRVPIATLFVLQLLLNYSWSPTFFAWHAMGAALVIIVAMILLTALLIGLVCRVRKAAALLLVPYLAWLCFAAALNYRIIELNPNAAELVPGRARTNIIL